MVKIYLLIDPRCNTPRYIGKTSQDLRLRLNNHISNYSLKTNTHKNSWIKSLKKKGLKPRIEILDIVPEIDWQFWEEYWICQFKTWGFNLTNGTLGGEGNSGGVGSKGYRHTVESKKRISIANSRPKSREWIDKQSKARYKPVLMLSLQGEIIKEWESATIAAISLFSDIEKKKNISACALGIRKSAYGYMWKFKVQN